MTRAVTLAEIADTNTFIVDGTNDRVGIGSTQPTEKLDVVGVVSATSFFGSGANLTGITAGATLSAGSGAQRVVVTSLTSGTMTSAATDAELTYNSTTNTLSATNISVGGTLTYEDVTNIDSVGLVTARSGLRVVGGGLTVTGVSTFHNNVELNANLDLQDADKILLGSGDDLEIYHSGFHSFIVNSGVGQLYIRASGGNIQDQGNANQSWLQFNSDAGVEAHFAGNKKFETTGGGVSITGTSTCTGSVQVGSGQSFGANGPTAIYYGDGSNLTGISAGISTTASSPSANTVVTLNLSTAQHHDLTLTAGITTITCSGGSFGDSHSVVISQPSSGIATVGFSTFFLFPSGATPSMSEGGSKVDLVSFVVKQVGAGGTQLLASAGLNYN